MAANSTALVTLADVAKSKDKKIGKVAEVLIKENQMLQDIPYMAMNMGTYHMESIRSDLPDVYYRKANQAIPASKTKIEERTFRAAHFESKSQMDLKVASRGGTDRIAFNRWNQAQGHIQAMANEHGALTLYGSLEDSPQKAPGFFDIYSSLNTAQETSKQIIDAGGVGNDNCSILMVHWGEQSIFGVYPNDTTAGLKREDHGKVKIQALDVNGNAGEFWGWEESFEIDHGLVVKDYRQAVRIANIDVSALAAGNGADLIDKMISGVHKIHNPSNGKGMIYVNRTVETFLDKQARRDVGGGGGLTYANYQGSEVLMFRGRPVRRCDLLLDSEDAVTT